MRTNKITVSTLLFCALSITVIIMQILPQVRYSVYFADILLAFSPFFVFFCLADYSILKKLGILFACIALMTVFRFIFNSFGNFTVAVNQGYELFLMCIPYFIFLVLAKRNDSLEIRLITLTILVILFIVATNTFSEFAQNPGVARKLATGATDDEEVNILRAANIGGYGFSYALGMLVPYVTMLICRHKGLARALLIVVLACLFIYAFYTQYTTLLLMSVISTLVVFILHIKDMMLKILLLVCGIFLLFNLSNIFLFMSNISGLETLSSHFEDLYKGLQGEGLSSSRPELTLEALKVFIRNPIFGTDLTDAANLFVINMSHTTFFSILASGGIFGTVFYYGILINMVYHIKRILPNFKDVMPVYVLFFVLGFFNPIIAFEIFVVVFLAIPAIELMLSNVKTPLKNGELVYEG